MNDKNFIFIFGSIFGGIGIILLASAIYFFNDIRASQKEAVKVQGKVIALQSSRGSKGGTFYTPLVEFELNQKSYQVYGSVASSPASFDVGEIVTLFVKPNRPEEAQIDTFMESWFVVLVLGGMGSVFTLIGGATVFSGLKSAQRLK
jgi:hypothetical protein